MKNFDDQVKQLTESLLQLQEVENGLVAITGTTNRAALDKVVKDCIDLDNSPLQAAKDMAQAIFPKALAAKQLVGFQSQIEMVEKDLDNLNELVKNIIAAGEAVTK